METWIEQFNDAQVHEIHALMAHEWWCSNRSIDEVQTVIDGSDLTLAALDNNQRISAFSRVLTDGIFKAVIFDVIVREDCRGTRLGEKLVEQLKQHPSLKHVKSLELYCPDRISGFYTKLGFKTSDSKLHRFLTG